MPPHPISGKLGKLRTADSIKTVFTVVAQGMTAMAGDQRKRRATATSCSDLVGSLEVPDFDKGRARHPETKTSRDWFDGPLPRPFPSVDKVPTQFRELYQYARAVDLPPLEQAETDSNCGNYLVRSVPRNFDRKSTSEEATSEEATSEEATSEEVPGKGTASGAIPQPHQLLFLSGVPVDLDFNVEQWLYAANRVLRDPKQPLLARRLAREFVVRTICLFAFEQPREDVNFVMVLDLGRLFERMQIACEERVAAHGRSKLKSSRKGGLKTKEIKKAELEAQMSTLARLINSEGKSRTEAMQQIAMDANVGYDRIVRKMKGYMTKKPSGPQKD